MMKKFTKIFLILLCFLMVTGCDVYVYNFDKNSNTGSGNSSSGLGGGSTGTGTTIITPNTNYTGFIDYTGSAPTETLSWDKVYSAVKTSVVTIRNISNDRVYGTGSGVFFAEEESSAGYAYIYTNAHVVKGSTSLEVLLHNFLMIWIRLLSSDY